MKVQIVLFDGFDELDAIAPFEVLKTAAEVRADVRVELVTLDGASEVVAAHGLLVRPEGQLDPDDRPDVLVVPGGGWNSRASKGGGASLNVAN
jgi:putative intracellular protease/amidase